MKNINSKAAKAIKKNVRMNMNFMKKLGNLLGEIFWEYNSLANIITERRKIIDEIEERINHEICKN